MPEEICVDVRVANPRNPKRSVTVRALVDNGAFDSAMPRTLLKRIGIRPRGREKYDAWAGRSHTRQWGEAEFRIQGKFGTVRVTFEPDWEIPTIGAQALETLGFDIDTKNETLRAWPARMRRGHRWRAKTPLRI